LLGGCSFSLFNGYRHGSGSRNGDIAPVSWFGSDSGHFLLNTRIDLIEKHLTGMMIIKPFGGDAYRVVFITEVGLKIFDMEFIPGEKVKLHYVMDVINRNAFIKTLAHDMRLLLMTLPEGKKTVLHDRDTGDPVIKFRDHGRRNYYHFPAGTGRASEAIQTGCMLKKARVEFYGSPVSGIDSVKITHYNINLRMQMFRIIEIQDHADE